jgi:hypothetical protein
LGKGFFAFGDPKRWYVRLSDLTQRARPLIKNIAETCKDVGVIAAAAGDDFSGSLHQRDQDVERAAAQLKGLVRSLEQPFGWKQNDGPNEATSFARELSRSLMRACPCYGGRPRRGGPCLKLTVVVEARKLLCAERPCAYPSAWVHRVQC